MSARLAEISQRYRPTSPWPGGNSGPVHEDGVFPPGHRPFVNDRWVAVIGWNPDNFPWELNQVVMALAEAANSAQVAAVLPEGDLRSELEAGAAATVDDILDEYCGTRPPWPGPPPWASAIASALSELGNTYQAGFLRDELLRIAGQAMQKAAARRKL